MYPFTPKNINKTVWKISLLKRHNLRLELPCLKSCLLKISVGFTPLSILLAVLVSVCGPLQKTRP